MKRILLVLAACVILATPVRADELLWAKALYVGLESIDWSQTRWHQAHGKRESNPFVPADPAGINWYFASAIVTNLLLVEWLPAPWGERYLFAVLGGSFSFVRHNYGLGIQATW